MTQEEVQQKKICVKCKWCLQSTIDHPSWTEFIFKCKNSVISINAITGDEEYNNCYLLNFNGDCSMYEERPKSWLERTFGKKEEE